MSQEMQTYLIEKARDEIWCNPLQDSQFIIKPERITAGAGALKTVFVMGRAVALPWSNSRAHVYQIGALSPSFIGLLELSPSWQKETWINVADTMSSTPLYANVYSETGVNVPRQHVYYMYTRDKCLIMAVKSDRRLKVNLATDNLYFRFYTNAYLKTTAPSLAQPVVQVMTFEINNYNDTVNAMLALTSSQARAGHTEIFINGFLVSEVSPLTVKIGDIVELVYETSVKRTVTWKVRDFRPFTSTLDNKFKYILHYPKAQVSDQIDFSDDIDVYVQYRDAQGVAKGYYYVRNLPDAMRMLTHRDYSLVGDYVRFISEAISRDLGLVVPDLLDFEVTLKIREGGYNRRLVKDANRIFELYKLNDNRILMAMSGVDSLVPVWFAASLEASAYTELMRSTYHGVTIELTEDAYGYNSISQILADTPIKTTGTLSPIATLPYELSKDSTVYEFDANGRMLGYYHHENDNDYSARSPLCRMIEGLVGKGTPQPSVVYGRNHLDLPEVGDWRLYQTFMDDSQPEVWIGGWRDITNDPTKYRIQNNQVVWIGPELNQYLMLRTNESFLAYSFDLAPHDGVLSFNLSETCEIEGVVAMRPMFVPAGDLQLYMNDGDLVQDIDYVVNFPYVCINNHSNFIQPTSGAEGPNLQRMHVRFSGFCDPDLTFRGPKHKGFVINGTLSDNRRYDIIDDKVMHISVAGSVMAKEDVKFFEDHPAWNPLSPLNGKPYQIKDIVVPLRDFTKSGTYPLLEKSVIVDKQVSDYMALYWEKPTNVPQTSSSQRYRLVSPFVSHLVQLCVDGILSWSDTKVFQDQEVVDICKPYEVLLKYDPVNEELGYPREFVNITPTRYDHTVNVSRAQYRFLEAVTRIYTGSELTLSGFVTFTV